MGVAAKLWEALAGGTVRCQPAVEEETMLERVKMFTFVSGHGETIAQLPQEDHINQWLSTVKGRFVHVSQSQSVTGAAGHHVTICVWYVPVIEN
jgi:hypothetical protein